MTLRPGWQLDTPHDLAAERIGVALGGVCTCVDLVDAVLPATRGFVAHRLRLEAAGIMRADDHAWCVAVAEPDCCEGVVFASAADAAAHLRRPEHWARRYGVPARAVVRLAQMILAAWAAAGAPVPADVRNEPACPAGRGLAVHYLVEPYGLAELWDAGVHPAEVAELCAELGSRGEPVALRAVLWLAYAPERDPWLAALAGEGPMVSGWAARHRNVRDHRNPDERLEWVRAGVPLPTIRAVMGGDAYTLADARALAAGAGLTLAGAARVLGRWQEAGLTPLVAQLVELHTGPRVLADPPPLPSVARTVDLARRAGVEVSLVAAALALVRTGTAPAAAARLATPDPDESNTERRSTA